MVLEIHLVAILAFRCKIGVLSKCGHIQLKQLFNLSSSPQKIKKFFRFSFLSIWAPYLF
jgi:hypothetical protein